jgi:hypothetical protein
MIRKPDKNGRAVIAINTSWKNYPCPCPDTASMPKPDHSNMMVTPGSNEYLPRLSSQD